jgi:hypothetical protein
MTTTLVAPTELQPVANANPFNAWKRKGEDLFSRLQDTEKAHETSQWDIGEWLVKGEDNFGKKAYEAAEQITDWARGTLYNVVSVVRRFPDPSLRSETALTWSHFKELARIKDEKKRLELLDKLDDGFPKTVQQVRDCVDKALEKKAPKQGQPATKAFYLRTSLKKEEKHLFRALAKKARKTTDQLLRKIVLGYIEEHKREVEIKGPKSRASKR